MFSGLGWTEMILVAAVLLLVFGGENLPDVLRAVGSGIRQFKQALNTEEFQQVRQEFETQFDEVQYEAERTVKDAYSVDPENISTTTDQTEEPDHQSESQIGNPEEKQTLEDVDSEEPADASEEASDKEAS